MELNFHATSCNNIHTSWSLNSVLKFLTILGTKRPSDLEPTENLKEVINTRSAEKLKVKLESGPRTTPKTFKVNLKKMDQSTRYD